METHRVEVADMTKEMEGMPEVEDGDKIEAE
jgi:hypothetical protein